LPYQLVGVEFRTIRRPEEESPLAGIRGDALHHPLGFMHGMTIQDQKHRAALAKLRILARWFLSGQFLVTNKRVVAEVGILSRDSVHIGLELVESVDVEQGFLGRCWDYGTVTITGRGSRVIEVPGLGSPDSFREAVIAESEKVKRFIRTED
jgi:hypothetical protein